MDNEKKQTTDYLNGQLKYNANCNDGDTDFWDANSLLASVQDEGLVNLTEGSEIFNLRNKCKHK